MDDDWNFRIVKTKDNSRWFADPFVLSVSDDTIVLLAEEYSYSIKRGRIARLTINRDTYEITAVDIILDLQTHLSFPAIFRDGESVYVYPENSASSRCILYKYDDASRKMEAFAELSDMPLTDAVMMELNSLHLVLSSYLPNPNGRCLGVFKSDSRFGPYRYQKDIFFDDYTARNAGLAFNRDGIMVRPAQIGDGGLGYGLGIEFQRIETDGKSIRIIPLERRFPPEGYDGMHTFNSLGSVHVVDLRRYLRPGLRKLTHGVKMLLFK